MSERVYLDWNATTPLRPEARTAMTAAFDCMGNPSSVHAEGRAARMIVEQARERVALLVGARPGDVIFTSGGSEANALALTPSLMVGSDDAPRTHLLVSAIEHPSVRAGGRFEPAAVKEVPVTSTGVIDLEALERQLATLGKSGARVFVALMHANNETGIVQPVAAAADIVHAAGGLLHVDAVQSAGKIVCNVHALGAHTLAISAHKMGGPKGAGALVKASDAVHIADPLIKGGGQERGYRGGTENVIGIAGFGAAAAATRAGMMSAATRMAKLRDGLETALLAVCPNAVIFGAGMERLPNTTLFAVPGVKAESAVIALDLAGIAVSSGAACSSGKVAGSKVLAAMDVPEALASAAIRVSIGPVSTDRDIEVFINAWRNLVAGLSKGKRGVAA
jgi:cysteine desulfurase